MDLQCYCVSERSVKPLSRSEVAGIKNSRVDFADIEQIQSLFTLQPHDLCRQTHLTTADTMTMNKLGFHGNIVSHYPVGYFFFFFFNAPFFKAPHSFEV